MAFTSTILSWSALSYKDAYREADQHSEILEAIKWATDYFIKCHVSPNEFYGQVGDFSLDHKFWGRPEEMNMARPAYKIDTAHPGSDLAAEVSAALSSASLLFRDINESYANELLQHAEELYQFGQNYKGLFQDVIPGAKEYYESKLYTDELTWAAVWLYKATKDVKYLEEAEKFYSALNPKDIPDKFFYNEKLAGIQVLLAAETNNTLYKTWLEKFCDYAIDSQRRTSDGLVYIDKFGTLSHAANIAFVCLEAANLNISALKYVSFAKEQIDYILGSKGRSFVVGFGQNFPHRPYHSASSCPDLPAPCGWAQYNSTLPNPQILYGALVSGPDANDHYEDVRIEFLYNEVTIDYNAGFQASLAGLIHYNNII